MNYLRVELLITTVPPPPPPLRLETLRTSLVKNTSINARTLSLIQLSSLQPRHLNVGRGNQYTPLPIAISSIYKVETTIESMRTPRYNGGILDLSLIFTFRIPVPQVLVSINKTWIRPDWINPCNSLNDKRLGIGFQGLIQSRFCRRPVLLITTVFRTEIT